MEQDKKEIFTSIKHSLKLKIFVIVLISSSLIAAAAIFLSSLTYNHLIRNYYEELGAGIATLAAKNVNGDDVLNYLSTGKTDSDYDMTKAKLGMVRDAFSDCHFIYVYHIDEDGCHVVFDLDTPELPANKLGDLVAFDKDFTPFIPQLLAGEEIEPVEVNGDYGWLLSTYKPIKDSYGTTVAYIGIDVKMSTVYQQRASFIKRIALLLFLATAVIGLLIMYISDQYVIEPINKLSNSANRFNHINGTETNTQQFVNNINDLDIKTGDEIENLYQSVKHMTNELVQYSEDIQKQKDEIQQKSHEIEKMQESVIMSFANMIEKRDDTTGTHVQRTKDYVEAIVKEMYREEKYPNILDTKYMEEVIQSAPLHDVGKIRISDVILNKPGKLTDKEFTEMEKHTTYGYEILEDSIDGVEDRTYINTAMELAHYHHEKWDGAGYPEHIKGSQIPLSARIMAVADVFDALVSKRSYKGPYKPEEAFKIIQDESGTHFDPEVVECFEKIQPQILDILKKYQAMEAKNNSQSDHTDQTAGTEKTES